MADKKIAKLTREELYSLVWQKPMRTLAGEFGLSDRGLSKICARMDIPVPPRGYWAKKQAGRKVVMPKLPEAGPDTLPKVVIAPTPAPPPPPGIPPEVQKRVDALLSSEIKVPERITRYHPLIAGWLADHRRRLEEARRDRSEWGSTWAPEPFTGSDRERHRILHVLLKALEKEDFVVEEGERSVLAATKSDERIEFQLREKRRQVKRKLTPDEMSWRSPGDRDWKQELVPTGTFVFEFKTSLPGGLRREWLEKDNTSMKSMLPGILTTFVSALPGLVKETEERQERERLRRIEEQRRYELQQQRKLENNRWRLLGEYAQLSEDVEKVRAFLKKLRTRKFDPDATIGDRTVGEWIAWAETQIEARDPFGSQVTDIFDEISQTTTWAYRD